MPRTTLSLFGWGQQSTGSLTATNSHPEGKDTKITLLTLTDRKNRVKHKITKKEDFISVPCATDDTSVMKEKIEPKNDAPLS